MKEFLTQDVIPLDALQDVTGNLHPKCKKFNGCIAQDKALVKRGDTFVYVTSNNEVYDYLYFIG